MKLLFQLFIASFLLVGLTNCDKCKDVSCDNGGTCIDGKCQCPLGFSGSSCEFEDKCLSNNVVCENDGVCEDGVCDCAKHYKGESCATYCVNGRYVKSSETCQCYPGWDSDGCTREMRLNWIAEYDLSSDCTQGSGTSVISAMEHPEEDSIDIAVNYVSMTNLTTAGDTKGYALIIPGNKLYVPSQKVKDVNGTPFTVYSLDTAAINGGDFELQIYRKFETFSTTCSNVYTRL